MLYSKISPGEAMSDAGKALQDAVQNLDVGAPYADTIRLRLSGTLKTECDDTYYVAHQNGECVSRLWNGWGKHPDAIGNFGNFLTAEAYRGQGIGKQMLELWYSDLNSRKALPLGLFCTASPRAAKLYFPYGFAPIMKGREDGPLFLPFGNSPRNFDDFCEWYYQPTQQLLRRSASFGWRHEIDCLLKFYFIKEGETFGIQEYPMLEAALHASPEKTELIFTQEGHCVGWIYNHIVQIHPRYAKQLVETAPCP